MAYREENGGGGRRGHGRTALGWVAVLVPLLLATVLASAASAQVATFSVSPVIQGPSAVNVGDTNVAGGLAMTNNSTGLGAVTLTSITYHPSCADFTLSCASPEPGVFSLSPTATGTAGACNGVTFTVSADASGRYTFAPPTPVVLATGATCTISFTFNVLRMPTTDAQPATPGVQTARQAVVQGTAAATAGGTVNGTSRAVATITVFPAQSTITTQVASPSVTLGSAVSDTATVSGPANVTRTGTVTFSLYGPNDANCGGAAVFTSTVALSGTSATSASFTPTAAGTYRWKATYNGDVNNAPATSPCNAPNETVQVLAAGRYEPLTPARILDTRTGVGTGGFTVPLNPGGTVQVQIAGQGGIPATGVSAVAMNVTVTQPTSSGFLTLYPTGNPLPLAANLTFTPGKTVPNLVVVKLGTGGKVDLYNSAGNTHVIFDVAGYFTDSVSGGDGRFRPLTPARVLDTRTGTGGSSVRLGPGASLDLQVAGAGGVPATGAEAVVMNVAVTNTSAESFLTVHPTGEARPLAANLNWTTGNTVSNRVIAKLGTNGRVTLYNNAGQTDLIVDVNGWFTNGVQATTGATYSAVTPSRILDTRTGVGGISGQRPAGSTVDVQVTGQGGLPPTGVTAVILNATVVTPAGPGFLTIFPTGEIRPNASDLNYASGEVRPNLVVVKVGTGGKVSLYTSTAADVVFDVAGYFS